MRTNAAAHRGVPHRAARLRFGVAAASIVVHAALVPYAAVETASVPEFAPFVLILIALCLALSIAGCFLVGSTFGYIALACRAVLILVASYSCPDGMVIRTGLVLMWYADAAVSARPSVALLASLVLLVVWVVLLIPAGRIGLRVAGTSRTGVLLDDETLAVLPGVVLSLSFIGLWHVFARHLVEYESLRTQAGVQEESIERLTEANKGFQEYARLLEERSIHNERKRITREVHDTTGYALTNLSMLLSAAKLKVADDPVTSIGMIEQARELCQSCLRETRIVLRKLRTLSTVPEPGVPTFLRLVRTFESSTGMAVHVEWGNTPRSLGEAANETVYRVLQEGLTNAFRHSRARGVEVHFRVESSTLNLDIMDDGNASEGFEEGLGLRGMRERIEAVEGRVAFIASSEGFRINVTIPLAGQGVRDATAAG